MRVVKKDEDTRKSIAYLTLIATLDEHYLVLLGHHVGPRGKNTNMGSSVHAVLKKDYALEGDQEADLL